MTTRWGIVEEQSYADAVKALGLSVKRLDELLEGASWLLARAADSEECTTEIEGIRLVKADLPNSENLLRVWFTVNSDTMMAHLIYIDIENKDDDEGGDW